jgi:hypothetical protein
MVRLYLSFLLVSYCQVIEDTPRLVRELRNYFFSFNRGLSPVTPRLNLWCSAPHPHEKYLQIFHHDGCNEPRWLHDEHGAVEVLDDGLGGAVDDQTGEP